ncbi:MAG: hypothetical protein IPM26_04720 [Saprospiraceae bacterium]|nr:hypothetical protein [Saprospiraceae bacterium]
MADTPKRARYNDGKYFFRSKVFNIHNDSITSDSVSCIIDNFKPYIEQFTASINGSAFYILERTGNEGVANMFDDGYVTNQHDQLNANISDIGVNLLNVKVRTSEMMKNLKIAHKKAGNAQFSNYLNMVQNESDSLIWEANIFGVFMQGDDLNVRIT